MLLFLRALLWMLVPPLTLTGCGSRVDVVARAVLDAGEGGPDGEAIPDAQAGTLCDHAARSGISLAGDRSLDALASETRQRALCTCGDFSGADAVRIDGGDAAIDGAMQLNREADFAAALRVAGAAGLSLGAGDLGVGAELAVGGPLLGSAAAVQVAGDADVAAEVQLAALRVGGTLRLPPDASLEVGDGMPPAQVVREAPEVTPVCGCDDGSRLDAAALVARTDARADLSDLAMGCSAVRVEAEQLPQRIEAREGGLLVIDGDLRLAGAFGAEVPAGRTLDLVVLGNVSVDGPLQLGSAGGGEVRLFVVGAGTLELKQGGFVHGVLHAPDVELVLPGPLAVAGSAVVRRVAAAASLTIER